MEEEEVQEIYYYLHTLHDKIHNYIEPQANILAMPTALFVQWLGNGALHNRASSQAPLHCYSLPIFSTTQPSTFCLYTSYCGYGSHHFFYYHASESPEKTLMEEVGAITICPLQAATHMAGGMQEPQGVKDLWSTEDHSNAQMSLYSATNL